MSAPHPHNPTPADVLKLGLFDGTTAHSGTPSMFDKNRDSGYWRTINGAHVHLNGKGIIDKGPAHLVGKTHHEAMLTPHPHAETADAKAGREGAQSAMTKGVFGQSVVDAGTGKQGSMFDTSKPAPVSEPIKGSKAALDPRNTTPLPFDTAKAAAPEAKPGRVASSTMGAYSDEMKGRMAAATAAGHKPVETAKVGDTLVDHATGKRHVVTAMDGGKPKVMPEGQISYHDGSHLIATHVTVDANAKPVDVAGAQREAAKKFLADSSAVDVSKMHQIAQNAVPQMFEGKFKAEIAAEHAKRQPKAAPAPAQDPSAKSKGHVGFITDADGSKHELYKTASGNLQRAPVSATIDAATGHRIGRFEASRGTADARAAQLMGATTQGAGASAQADKDAADKAAGTFNTVRAPKGGAIDPVTGEFVPGGRGMNIHGDYAGQEKKPKAEPQGTAGGTTEHKDGGKPREPLSKEELAAHQRQAGDRKKWEAIKAGPVGQVAWMGDKPGKHALPAMDKWQAYAESIGPEKVARLRDALEAAHNQRIDTMAASWDAKDRFTGQPMTAAQKAEAVQWEKDEPKRQAEQDAKYQPRNVGSHEKKFPGSMHARQLASSLMDPKDTGKGVIDNLHDVHGLMANATATTPASAGRAAAESIGKPLDHGELNVPGRTNNINRDLDRYKADQATKAKVEQKANAVERRNAKATAKELAARHLESMVARHGDKLGTKEVRATLESMVKWHPKKFIQMVYKHVAETSV